MDIASWTRQNNDAQGPAVAGPAYTVYGRRTPNDVAADVQLHRILQLPSFRLLMWMCMLP